MATKICKNGHTFEKTSDCPTCPTCATKEIEIAYKNGFPIIGSPAYNALKHEGISLSDLPKFTEKELLAIHGVGPKAIGILSDYLAEKGLSFVKK